MEIKSDTFVEYPLDSTQRWGAKAVIESEGVKVVGYFPPEAGMPGASTASEAQSKAIEAAKKNLTAIVTSQAFMR